jgi:PD-(D/E)XK nuclease superfamily protein
MEGLTPSQKGAVAELEFACEALKLGFRVYRPVAEGGRCDLILGIDERLLRVQCKLGMRIGEVVSVRPVTSCRTRDGGYLRRSYGAHEVDAIGVYCDDIRKCYLVPISLAGGRKQIYLRLSPTKNQQQVGVHLAEQYELGAIAQLGER